MIHIRRLDALNYSNMFFREDPEQTESVSDDFILKLVKSNLHNEALRKTLGEMLSSQPNQDSIQQLNDKVRLI